MSLSTVGMWLYRNGGGEQIQRKIVHKLQDRGIKCITGLDLKHAQVKNGAINCNGVSMDELDAFLSYNAGEQTPYQRYLYQMVSHVTPTINNFDSFAIAEDKFQTSHLLNLHGVTTPDYRLVGRDDYEGLKQAMTDFGGKMIYKPVDGWGGSGIVKIEGENALKTVLPFIEQTELRYFYLEKFVTYDNTDYRIDIVDGKFVGCYGRKAPKGEWKTNITSGGSVFVREPDQEVIELAIKSAKILGLEIAGVDIIYDQEREEYVVLEVNTIPAFATPEQEQLGINFNQHKIDALVNLLERTVHYKAREQTIKVA
ncbi:hypothetical protein CS022_21650 [Veronia nyctiphanis]|uniref:ATP-grasp domain-containing protein n=1 Tax=Veronia nyctiphanis TaxID=1278244 RepID=A0A4Q0YK96_9GAMM|nr:ATP-grasp domain-containing protein [Veronia nyctiphanis]RXJ71147.1 hypothetical protein CS022_21650 [Veronia nyctiphanis]